MSDLLNPASCQQDLKNVVACDYEGCVFAPSRKFIFTSAAGREDWIVYRAKAISARTCRYRTARAQPFACNADGMANLEVDVPAPSGEGTQ